MVLAFPAILLAVPAQVPLIALVSNAETALLSSTTVLVHVHQDSQLIPVDQLALNAISTVRHVLPTSQINAFPAMIPELSTQLYRPAFAPLEHSKALIPLTQSSNAYHAVKHALNVKEKMQINVSAALRTHLFN